MEKTFMPNGVILRLSSIGDICHCLPVAHSLAKANYQVFWIIDERCSFLLKNLDFKIIVVKKNQLKSYLKIRSHNFEKLFHIHPSLSANIVSLFIKTKNKRGLANIFAKDMQRLFVHSKPPNPKTTTIHQVDRYLGVLDNTTIKKHHCFDLG